jgi:hypothetical protein
MLRMRSPTTCWRGLTEWATAGVFDQFHLVVLDRLGDQGRLEWERASADTMSVRAKREGDHMGANPVDRGKPGSSSPGLQRQRATADRGGDRGQG